ncbi:MAG: hydrogenase [Chitinophagaceae bacterium]|nr:hydrogenase [Chitinophagaceae bacterium]
MNDQTSRRLKMLGMLLFLLGLLTGLLIMEMKNTRMGLAAHLEGVMNGTFLVVAGFVWNELRISAGLRKILFWTLLYGTFVNWLFTLLSAILGTSRMTPISGAGYSGTELNENLVSAGLVTVALTMVFSLAVIIYGLRGKV